MAYFSLKGLKPGLGSMHCSSYDQSLISSTHVGWFTALEKAVPYSGLRFWATSAPMWQDVFQSQKTLESSQGQDNHQQAS